MESKRAKKKPVRPKNIHLFVNGTEYELENGNKPGRVDYGHTLAYTLRETIGLTGTKVACDHGACACCTVLMEDKPILSCMTLTVECDGKKITTIEGLKNPDTDKFDPLQQAFIDLSAFQCGYCTPGMIMSAKALLLKNPTPTIEEIKEGLSGNFCRCISNYQVIDAIVTASNIGGGKE